MFISPTSGIRAHGGVWRSCDVFVVPTQRGQKKPKWPTHKDPEEKKKKRKAQQMNIANGAK